MPFIKLTCSGETLIVLNTDHIAQVEVNPDTYNTVITMADGEEICVEESLPDVMAMLMPPPDLDKGLMTITIEQLKARIEQADKLIEELQAAPADLHLDKVQRSVIAAALHQLARSVEYDLRLDPIAQDLLAPIARRVCTQALRDLATTLLKDKS